MNINIQLPAPDVILPASVTEQFSPIIKLSLGNLTVASGLAGLAGVLEPALEVEQREAAPSTLTLFDSIRLLLRTGHGMKGVSIVPPYTYTCVYTYPYPCSHTRTRTSTRTPNDKAVATLGGDYVDPYESYGIGLQNLNAKVSISIRVILGLVSGPGSRLGSKVGLDLVLGSGSGIVLGSGSGLGLSLG